MEVIEPIAQPETKPDIPTSPELADKAADIVGMKLEGYFGVQNPGSVDKKSLDEITRLLDGNSKDTVDFLWEIKNVENRIGTPPLGMSRIQHVFNFIKINSQINNLERERDLYVG